MPNAGMLDTNIRYVILGKKKNIDNFDYEGFKLIRKMECWVNDEYMLAEIQPINHFTDYALEDIMAFTDSLAIHEEYTNGIITTTDNLDKLGDIYCWSGAGSCLLGDMLTETEKLSCLLQNYYMVTKERIDVEDIGISISKNGPEIPISDNLDKLFSNDVGSVFYKGKKEYLWWPTIIEGLGYFLVVIDDELAELEDDDIPYCLKEDNSWGSLYEENEYEDEAGHYINDYYKRKGLI